MNNENKQIDNNTGLLFNKQSEDQKKPNKVGFAKIDGKQYKIAIWERKSKAGNDYLYFKIEPQTSISE